MPIHEYHCQDCNLLRERIELASASGERSEPPKCPSCESPMQRLVSAAAFQLKGAGFHANDYKAKK